MTDAYNQIIAYLIWKGSYNLLYQMPMQNTIIAYLIWKGSYNRESRCPCRRGIIAYLIWKGSYNRCLRPALICYDYSISDLERKL